MSGTVSHDGVRKVMKGKVNSLDDNNEYDREVAEKTLRNESQAANCTFETSFCL